MKYSDHINIINHEKNINSYTLEICDAPLQCETCYNFLSEKNELRVKEIINTILPPESITQIKFEIIPNERGLKYYSFDGIENIVSYFLRVDFDEHIKELSEIKHTYVKAYYSRKDYYNSPVLNIELIFPEVLTFQLLDELIDNYNYFIKNKTGSPMKYNFIELNEINILSDLLDIKLLKGQKEFEASGIFNFLTKTQINEMNLLNAINIKVLDFDAPFPYKLFDAERFIIEKYACDENNSESIMEMLDEKIDNSDFDDLPF